MTDPAFAAAIEARWPRDASRWTIHALVHCSSTMDQARALLDSGAVPRTVVIAREQSSGRGRLGRVFVSPRGGLYLTAILAAPSAIQDAWRLGFAAALAARDALVACGAGEPLFDWPNDLVLGERKVGGVLAELITPPAGSGTDASVLVGIGLNVGPDPRTIDPAAAGAGGPIRVNADDAAATVAAALLPSLASWSARCEGAREWNAVLQSVRSSSTVGRGAPVTIRRHDGSLLTGEALSLEDDGALSVRVASGHVVRVRYGEVVREAPQK